MSIEDRLHWFAAQYVASPQWFKTIVGGAYSVLPRRVWTGRSYSRFALRFQTFDAAQQDDRLAQTLSEALRGVPAFAAYRGLADEAFSNPRHVLAQLPLTHKEDIKRNLQRYLNLRQPTGNRLEMFTGGSTAVPMTFYIQRGVGRAKELAAFDTLARRFGTDGEGVVLALRGRSVPTATAGRMWMYDPIRRYLILSSDHLEPRYMPQYVEALRHRRPSYVHAFPSALYPLVLWLRDNGLQDVLASVRCVTLFSETVFEHHMAAFRQFFGCPVIVTYGHTERVLFATTLPDDLRYHFWPQYGHFELVDGEGRSVTQPGQVGEIVGTSFDNLVMPFVRYRTGDYAVLGSEPDASMPGSPVVQRIEGRLQEFIVCADHRLVTVTTIGAAHLKELEQCLRIQYEQHEPGRLTLRVMPLQPMGPQDKQRVRDAIRHKTQGGCETEVVEVDNIDLTARGKQRLLIQHLDISSYLGSAMNKAVSFAPAVADPPAELRTTDVAAPALLEAGRFVLMVGTSGSTQGGIAAVVNNLRDGGLFDQVPTVYVESHCDGSRWDKARRFVVGLGRTVSQLQSGRVALLHAHVSSGGSFWRKSMILSLARWCRVPTVFHLHSGGFSKWASKPGIPALWRGWIRHTIESSSVVIALNQATKTWLAEFAPRARVIVIGNPVIIPPSPDPGALPVAPAAAAGRVLYLGWIYDFKGCYDLLQAWVLFRQQCPGWRLVVGGKGEVKRFLGEAEKLGVRGDIDFLGWVRGEDKEQQFRRADILILPSYHEGMPMSVLEAMAHGIAVVATPVGGVVDMMVPDVHGLWIQPGDIEGISARLVELARSPERRRSLGGAAREHVIAHNSVASVIGQLIGVYRGVLGARRVPD